MRAPAVLLSIALLLPAAAAAPRPAAARKARPVLTDTTIVFAGVPWQCPADSAATRLRARGYRVLAGSYPRDQAVFQGSLFDHVAVVRGTLDEQGRIVRWEVTLEPDPVPDIRPHRVLYVGMRSVYDDVVAECGTKYGDRWTWEERYQFPYERGDGQEEKALADRMASIRSVWRSRAGEQLTVEMAPSCAVVMTYESPDWLGLQSRVRRQRARDL